MRTIAEMVLPSFWRNQKLLFSHVTETTQYEVFLFLITPRTKQERQRGTCPVADMGFRDIIQVQLSERAQPPRKIKMKRD